MTSQKDFLRDLRTADPAVSQAIGREHIREEDGLEMIASENYVSRAVLEAQGSVLTNKYAEGYPGKRYYGGCEFVDQVESLAIERIRSFSAPKPRTFSRTRDLRPIWRPTSRSPMPETRFWECRFLMADI